MSTKAATPIAPPPPPDGDPDHTPEQKPAKVARKPHDPIRRLWRYSKGDRLRLIVPFVGKRIWIDRWHGRVAANGDTQYEGILVAYAISTLGSASDLLILHTGTGAGMTWAISAAQIAELQLAKENEK